MLPVEAIETKIPSGQVQHEYTLRETGDQDDPEAMLQSLLEREMKTYSEYKTWLAIRRVLLSGLFFAYVGASVGIPFAKSSTVSCENGFFWEDHLLFLGIFCTTKLVELALYSFDPTIQGELDLGVFMLNSCHHFWVTSMDTQMPLQSQLQTHVKALSPNSLRVQWPLPMLQVSLLVSGAS